MRLLILSFSIVFFSCEQSANSKHEQEVKKITHTTNANNTSSIKNISSTPVLPTPKVPLTRVGSTTPMCSNNNVPSGNHPLIDLYCGALGKKSIEIYITGVDESEKTLQGYSIVNNSRTNFEGTFSTKEHKAPSHKADNIVAVASTFYNLILREPSQANTNGVFNIEIDISDIGRTGYGVWISYNGMLYREIRIFDRLNDL